MATEYPDECGGREIVVLDGTPENRERARIAGFEAIELSEELRKRHGEEAEISGMQMQLLIAMKERGFTAADFMQAIKGAEGKPMSEKERSAANLIVKIAAGEIMPNTRDCSIKFS